MGQSLPHHSIWHLHDLNIIPFLTRLQEHRTSLGTWRTSRKETHSHYHFRLLCVPEVEPMFLPSSLSVPPDVLMHINASHRHVLVEEVGIDM